jgi:3-oxoacyl-[acyl-carrier-protein] synthase II
VHIAAEVKNFVPSEYGIDAKEARRLDLFAQYGLAAARQAIVQSRLQDGQFDSERVGVIIGTGIGGLKSIEVQAELMVQRGPSRVSPTLVPSAVPDVAANEIALMFGFKGPTCAVSTACSSGNDAIIFAIRCIREGSTDIMIAGGAEATVTPMSLATFGNLKALTRSQGDPTKACRPFDRDRSGFVMGEGAGVLVLESIEHARRRGAKILGLVAGYGQTCDSYHRTAPDPTGVGAARAIQQALRMSGLRPEDIDYINAHGTSTISNDPMETQAIKRALGDAAYKTAVSSTKSMTGHLIGAAGAVEAIVCVEALQHGIVPPTVNLDNPDPECDLDCVPHQARRKRVRAALSNSFGFGGHNAAVIFAAP